LHPSLCGVLPLLLAAPNSIVSIIDVLADLFTIVVHNFCFALSCDTYSGETVTIANLMESSGEPGKIQVYMCVCVYMYVYQIRVFVNHACTTSA